MGSLHCVGMCGPLAMGIPSFQSGWAMIQEKIQYNFGRILTYALLGILLGWIGRRLWVPELQEKLSIGLGILILALSGFRFSINQSMVQVWGNQILIPIQNGMLYAIKHRAGNFWIGALNGFLPCGMVYLALAGAINTLSPHKAGLYMIAFGLGTFPLMLTASLGSGWASPKLRKQLNRISPYFIVLMGFWFIFRGLHLNIPYLSPGKINWGATICH